MISFLFSLGIFVIVLGVLVIIHEFGHFIAAKKNGIKVEKFSFGFGPRLFGIKRGDTDYCVSAIIWGGYVKLAGDDPSCAKGDSTEFLSKTVGQRFTVVFFGPLFNYVLAFLLFWLIFFVGSPTLTNKIGVIMDKYPAKAVGIQEGDRILSVDDKDTQYWEGLTEIIHNADEDDLVLTVERETSSGVKVFDVRVSPKRREITDIFGKKRTISLIGIMPSDETVNLRYGFFESFYKSGETLYKLTTITGKAIMFMVSGKMSVKESVAGPIGIFIITSKAAKLGFMYLLQMMAILSASLAIFNLLPIPVLDGGHILFLFIEKLRGKPVSIKFQEFTMQAGLALLLMFMLFILYNDFIKFVLNK